MIRKILAAAFVVALVMPSAAHAQIGFGVSAGPSKPMGDFGDIAKTGYQFSGLLNLSIPLAPFGFRFEGSVGQYDYKSAVGLANAKARVISGTANAMLSTPGFIGPYVIGGVGYYRSTTECTGCSAGSNKVGFNGGAGVRVGLLGFSAFAEARYHSASSTQFIPLSVGVTF